MTNIINMSNMSLRFTEEFQPNISLNFGEGSLVVNRLAESSLTEESNNRAKATFCVRNVRYWELLYDYEWYRERNDDDYAISLCGDEWIDTNIIWPSDAMVVNEKTGLNIVANVRNIYLWDIAVFLNKYFDLDVEENRPPYYFDDVWSPKFFPYDFEYAVKWGDEIYEPVNNYYDPRRDFDTAGDERYKYWQKKMVCMPSYAPIFIGENIIEGGLRASQSLDGTHGTIIIEGSRRYRKSLSSEDANDVFKNAVVLCADPRLINPYSYHGKSKSSSEDITFSPEGEAHEVDNMDVLSKVARKGFFQINGRYSRFLIVNPGTVVKVTTAIETVQVEGGKEDVLVWVVTNGQFEEVDGVEVIEAFCGYCSDIEDIGEFKDSNGKMALPRELILNKSISNGRELSYPLLVTKELKKAFDESGAKSLNLTIAVGTAYRNDIFEPYPNVVYDANYIEYFSHPKIEVLYN